MESHERIAGLGPHPSARTEKRGQDHPICHSEVVGGKCTEAAEAQAGPRGPDAERRSHQQGRIDIFSASVSEDTSRLSLTLLRSIFAIFAHLR